MSKFDQAFQDLLGNEGKYSNDPADPGGETMWGITEAVARENGYMGAMAEMDVGVAKAIYARKYWLPVYDTLAYPLAFQLFDATVNSGAGQAVRWLQRAVGVADDGKFGPVTTRAVEAQSIERTIALFNAERLQFMTDLSTWKAFSKGWARRIVNNLRKGMA